MGTLLEIVKNINSVLWNSILLFVLLGTGLYFTFKLRFIQVRKLKASFRLTFGNIKLKGGKAGKDGMSSFQSLATAIASQVGTGNLAGAATAIASGGPGAVFWMWLSAFFGMATNYAEATLGQKFKTKDLLEANLYMKDTFQHIRNKIAKNKVSIKEVFGINGKIFYYD